MTADEKKLLLSAASKGIAMGNTDLEHLSNTAAVSNYIRIADEIKKILGQNKKILDWGCGYGQMTFLLKNRGYRCGEDIIAYDVVKRNCIEKIQPFSELPIIYGHPTDEKLPFENNTFNAVLSCGTLEHVANPDFSLDEIRRILKPDGLFLIYMLPSRFSWSEKIADMRGISSHPVKYTKKSIRQMLRQHNFEILKLKSRNFLPKNLTGLPSIIKNFYGALGKPLLFMDAILSSVPPINIFCGTFEIIAKKT